MGMRSPRLTPDQLPPVSPATMLRDLRSTLVIAVDDGRNAYEGVVRVRADDTH